MCEYKNPAVEYWMKDVKKDLNSLVNNIIELKKVGGLMSKKKILKNEIENISKLVDIFSA